VSSGDNGFDVFFNDLWQYDPSSDSWTTKANYSGPARESAVGFSVNEKGYITTGETWSNYSTDLWEYTPEECSSETDSTLVIFPNTFSPNGDGSNDNFIPVKQVNIKNPELRVYNRWGNELFHTDDFSKGWTGTHNGLNCPDGTYYWTAEYNGSGKANGFVMLVR
jgi:gliding motility-associated-like protein